MIQAERWRDNWLAVSPTGAVRLDLRRSRAGRTLAKRTVGELPPGTPVVLFASAPGAIRRCGAFASQTGLEVEHAYLAFPSAHAPGYLVEDDRAPIRFFIKTTLATPPGAAFSALIEAGLGLVRGMSPWRLLRVIAPGRIVVGRRM